MKSITIQDYESGQKLERYLSRYLKEASKGFLYKMMRKKNITLNGKKVEGKEILQTGDEIRLFFSDETLQKFMGSLPAAGENAGSGQPAAAAGRRAVPQATAAVQPGSSGHRAVSPERRSVCPPVLYEDEDVIFLNKPAGMLSQKARPEDVSVCEHLTAYLLETGALTEESLRTFRPSVCNRLDRNTSGVIAAGKSIRGLQVLSEHFRERDTAKYYLCLVHGTVPGPRHVSGWLVKDEASNTVRVSKEGPGDRIITEYEPLSRGDGFTLLQVRLITGKTHQIRAHLASEGYPVLGDSKYGSEQVNREFRRNYPLRCQLLHSWRLVFPPETDGLPRLAGRTIEAPLPPHFAKCVRLLHMEVPGK